MAVHQQLVFSYDLSGAWTHLPTSSDSSDADILSPLNTYNGFVPEQPRRLFLQALAIGQVPPRS